MDTLVKVLIDPCFVDPSQFLSQLLGKLLSLVSHSVSCSISHSVSWSDMQLRSQSVSQS